MRFCIDEVNTFSGKSRCTVVHFELRGLSFVWDETKAAVNPREHDGITYEQPVAQRGRGDDQVGLREGVSALAALLDEPPPLRHHVFAHRQHAALEHRAHLQVQPVVQIRPPAGVGQAFDAEADFGQRHHAQK